MFGTGGALNVSGTALPVNGDAMSAAVGLGTDCDGSRLLVSDTGIERTTEFDFPLSDTTADDLFGQTSLTATYSGPASANTNGDPYGIAVDLTHDVYIADAGYSRVVEFDAPFGGCVPPPSPTPTDTPTETPTPADQTNTPTTTPTVTATPTATVSPSPTATATPPTLSTATVIPTLGGTIAISPGGSAMTFASGGLPADTLITLAQFSPGQAPPAPAGQHALTTIEVGASASAFGAAVTVSLPYNPADLGGAHPDALQIRVYDDASWRPIGGTTDELVGATSVTTLFGSPAFDD